MKIPFRYQISEYDCVPTVMINGLIHLFDRRDIPPMIIRHIFIYSLDEIVNDEDVGKGGTSRFAVQLLSNWLASYKTSRFSLGTEYLEFDQVHLRQGNKIVTCLNSGGVALCNILLKHAEEHFVLALKADVEWIYVFDPYRRQALEDDMEDNVRVLKRRSGNDPNLAIRREWLDGFTDQRQFCFGLKNSRECLLMWRDNGHS
ncbi:MAG: hypothetical protein O2954_11055 [bacterium]|nr:hypothetical protein [bacterium]